MLLKLAKYTRILGFALKHVRIRRQSEGERATRRLTAYCVVPIWLGAGFLDYLYHRRTRIETTSGIGESLTHILMMVEAGPVILAALFAEMNAGSLALMIALSILHEATVLADLKIATPRRVTPAGEQVVHAFLEAPLFVVTAAAIVTHWSQFQALLGLGRARARYGIHLQFPSTPISQGKLILGAMLLLGALPHADELRRCLVARPLQAAPPALPIPRLQL